jgi:hypothetical protein
MPRPIPDVFMDAAIQELTSLGYYRTEPEIEVQVQGDFISFTSTSKIVTFNGKASVTPPKSSPTKGLSLVEEFYEVDDKEVRAPLEVQHGAADRYFVKFKRRNSKVKEVSDTHYWLSPVTAFVVTFQYSKSHSCGVAKLTGRTLGLPPESSSGNGKGRIVYKHESASFSGQGFNWWVRWLNKKKA